MRQSHPFHAAASHSKGLHGHLNGLVDRSERHDQARHDDVLHMPVETGIGSLPCVEGEADISVPQVLGFCKTRREDVRHDGRLDKLKFHDFPRPGLVVALAQEETNHDAGLISNHIHGNISDCAQSVIRDGKFITTSFNTLGFSNSAAASSRHPSTPTPSSPEASKGQPTESSHSLAGHEFAAVTP